MLPFNVERSESGINDASEGAAATVFARNKSEAATKRRPSAFDEG